jgi:hypothetical protein
MCDKRPERATSTSNDKKAGYSLEFGIPGRVETTWPGPPPAVSGAVAGTHWQIGVCRACLSAALATVSRWQDKTPTGAGTAAGGRLSQGDASVAHVFEQQQCAACAASGHAVLVSRLTGSPRTGMCNTCSFQFTYCTE